MSRFAALKSEDEEKEDENFSGPLEKLAPQYSFSEIISFYNDSPKNPDLIRENFRNKFYEDIFVESPIPPECNSFTPPKSEINSPLFLSPQKLNQRQNQQQNNKKGQKANQKQHQSQNANQQNQRKNQHQNTSTVSITLNQQQQKDAPQWNKHQNKTPTITIGNTKQDISKENEIKIDFVQKQSNLQPIHIQQTETPKIWKDNINESIMWYYKDPFDNILGPFPSDKMREWLEFRFIDKTLLIRQANIQGKFQSISSTFPDISNAFRNLNYRPSDINFNSSQGVNTDFQNSKDVSSLFSLNLTESEESDLSIQMKIK